jgi:hypothetical protein
MDGSSFKNMVAKFTLNSHYQDQKYSLQKEGESCHELGLVCNLDEKRTSLYNVSEDSFF